MRTLLFGSFVLGAILVAGCNDVPVMEADSLEVSLQKDAPAPCSTCPGTLILDAMVELDNAEIGNQDVVTLAHVSGTVKFIVEPSHILIDGWVNIGTTLSATVAPINSIEPVLIFTGNHQIQVKLSESGTGSFVQSCSTDDGMILSIQYTVTRSSLSVSWISVSGPSDLQQ